MAILRDVLAERLVEKVSPVSLTEALLPIGVSFQATGWWPTYKWNKALAEYENRITGETVSEEGLSMLGVGYAENAVGPSIENLTDRFIDGEITLAQWEERMAGQLKDAHLILYQISRGGKAAMDFSDYGRVGGVLRWEYAHLEQFAIEISLGTLTDAQIRARAQLYVGSIRKAYYGAKTAAHKAAGYTEERRVITPDETCVDCIRMVAQGWQPIGSLPEPGQDSVCDGNCKCAKEYRKEDREKTIEEILREVPEGPPPEFGYLDPGYPLREELPWDIAQNSKDWVSRGGSIIGGNASQAKDAIVTELSERTGIPYERVNEMIKQWSWTSNDEAYGALEIQKVAAEMYGIDLSDWQQDKYDEIFAERERAIAGDFPAGFNRRKASVFELKPGELYSGMPEHFENSEEAVEAVLSSMYKHTQEELADADIDYVYLWRGTTGAFEEEDMVEAWATKEGVQLDSNALESWTANAGTATDFSEETDYGINIFAKVPADRVLGSARTGFGCLGEYEYVIIGNMPDDMVRIEDLVSEDWEEVKDAYDPFSH